MAIAHRLREAASAAHYAYDVKVAETIMSYEEGAASSAAVTEAMMQARYGADPHAAITRSVLLQLRRTCAGGRFENGNGVSVILQTASQRLSRRSPIFMLHALRSWLAS